VVAKKVINENRVVLLNVIPFITHQINAEKEFLADELLDEHRTYETACRDSV
jgi:hypothetical protein